MSSFDSFCVVFQIEIANGDIVEDCVSQMYEIVEKLLGTAH
jgi:hypothetical protein